MDKIPYLRRKLINYNTVSLLRMKMFKKIKKINWQLNINANDLLHISSSFKAGIFECDKIRSWAEVNFKNITNQSNLEELKNQCLWLNSHIRVGNKPIFMMTWLIMI